MIVHFENAVGKISVIMHNDDNVDPLCAFFPTGQNISANFEQTTSVKDWIEDKLGESIPFHSL